MFVIVGIVVVLGSVVGGFLLEGGPLGVLIQPIEVLIIGGAALGSFFISNPKSLIMDVVKHIPKLFTGKEIHKETYLAVLSVLYELMNTVRKGGIVAVEPHVNNPTSSAIFSKHKDVVGDKALLAFICDNFKVLVAGNIQPHQFDNIMAVDIDTQAHHHKLPPQAINKLSDSLPGLGIVAAVLGIVITMGKINEPPEVLGHSIGAALVGTFLGILMCYGFFGPAATNLDHAAAEKMTLLACVKEGLVGFSIGLPPLIAVESARRAVPGHARPTFEEMEEAMKNVR